MAALLGGGGLLEEEREALLQAATWLGKALAVENRIAEPCKLDDALRPPHALFWGDHLSCDPCPMPRIHPSRRQQRRGRFELSPDRQQDNHIMGAGPETTSRGRQVVGFSSFFFFPGGSISHLPKCHPKGSIHFYLPVLL